MISFTLIYSAQASASSHTFHAMHGTTHGSCSTAAHPAWLQGPADRAGIKAGDEVGRGNL